MIKTYLSQLYRNVHTTDQHKDRFTSDRFITVFWKVHWRVSAQWQKQTGVQQAHWRAANCITVQKEAACRLSSTRLWSSVQEKQEWRT